MIDSGGRDQDKIAATGKTGGEEKSA